MGYCGVVKLECNFSGIFPFYNNYGTLNDDQNYIFQCTNYI